MITGPHLVNDFATINAGQWTPTIFTYLSYDGQVGRGNVQSNGIRMVSTSAFETSDDFQSAANVNINGILHRCVKCIFAGISDRKPDTYLFLWRVATLTLAPMFSGLQESQPISGTTAGSGQRIARQTAAGL